jgi:protease I
MTGRLVGKRIALLIEDDYDAREVTEPLSLLKAEGAEVVLVGPQAGASYRDKTRTGTIAADLAAGAAKMSAFDALVIPGGHAPDKIRMRHAMIDLVKDAMTAGKPVAAICHGPQVLITANAVRGRTITCWPSIAIDIKNAGGLYVDRPMVRDGNVITARKVDDIPVFCEAIVEALQ